MLRSLLFAPGIAFAFALASGCSPSGSATKSISAQETEGLGVEIPRSTSSAANVPYGPMGRAPNDADAALGRCGDKSLGPCPLYTWMRDHTSPAMNARDYPAISAAFEEVADFAPPGYTNWASIARDGANAARIENIGAVRAACRGCHTQYKDRYKKELRDRAI